MKFILRPWFFAVAAVLAVILIVIVIYGLRPALPVWVTVPVRQGNIESTVSAIGRLDAVERVNVGAQVSGQVKSLTIKVGDKVEKGQLIAEIDDLPQRNDLRNSEAALNVASAELQIKQATLKRQQAQFRRQQRLLKEGASSRQDYEAALEAWSNAKADLAAQQARIIQAQIEVEKKRLDLSYTKIMAPMDGTVIAIITKEGQTVNASQSAPTIAKLARLDTMTIRVQISEADINSVRPGQKAWFTIFSEPEKRYDATLLNIELAPDSVMKDDAAVVSNNDSASANSLNAAVYYNALLDVPNPDNKFRIAMTAQVFLLRNEAKNALLLPVQSVRTAADGRQYVEMPGKNNRPQIRYITTGISDSIDIQVLSGLKPGEVVILGEQSAAADKAML